MRWCVKHGDILDQPADVLVCSANVFLNLSGGVGGEILLRHGDEMQRELHRYLADRRLQFVHQGDVVPSGSCGTIFKSVLHAVAVDAFYQSSTLVIGQTVAKAPLMSASMGARRVALTALGTGYGRMTMKDFAQGVLPVLEMATPPVEEVVICLRNPQYVEELFEALRPPSVSPG